MRIVNMHYQKSVMCVALVKEKQYSGNSVFQFAHLHLLARFPCLVRDKSHIFRLSSISEPGHSYCRRLAASGPPSRTLRGKAGNVSQLWPQRAKRGMFFLEPSL